MKYKPSKIFGSGTEYDCFKYEYCEKCVHHKVRPDDGFPAFIEDGGCPIEDRLEMARFDPEEYPQHYIWQMLDDEGQIRKYHHCTFFRNSNEVEVNVVQNGNNNMTITSVGTLTL